MQPNTLTRREDTVKVKFMFKKIHVGSETKENHSDPQH